MKGYVIFDEKTGTLRHHGTHHELPTPDKGQKLVEITPEQEASIPPARGPRFVRAKAPSGAEAGGLPIGLCKFGDLVLWEGIFPPDERVSPQGTLEKEMAELRKEVVELKGVMRGLGDRLEKMFGS